MDRGKRRDQIIRQAEVKGHSRGSGCGEPERRREERRGEEVRGEGRRQGEGVSDESKVLSA